MKIVCSVGRFFKNNFLFIWEKIKENFTFGISSG